MEDNETTIEVFWYVGSDKRSSRFSFCNDERTCDYQLEEFSKLISRLDALCIPWHVFTPGRNSQPRVAQLVA